MKREDSRHLADPSVEPIKSYVFESRPIMHDGKKQPAQHWRDVCADQGGFNPISREFTPMRNVGNEMSMYEALDHCACAVEAGVVDKNSWAEQLFVDEEELEAFFDELECYDQCYRITDRWWTALAAIAGRVDEEGFVACEEIVAGLRESVVAGRRRREMLIQEAAYFAQLPVKEVKVTNAQALALSKHNIELRRKAYEVGPKFDVSCDFRFTRPFYYMKGKVLSARQVTREDLDALGAKVTPTAVRPKALSKPATGKLRKT